MRGVKHVRQWEAEILDGQAAGRQRVPVRRRHPAAVDARAHSRDLVGDRQYRRHRRRAARRALVGAQATQLGLTP